MGTAAGSVSEVLGSAAVEDDDSAVLLTEDVCAVLTAVEFLKPYSVQEDDELSKEDDESCACVWKLVLALALELEPDIDSELELELEPEDELELELESSEIESKPMLVDKLLLELVSHSCEVDGNASSVDD